MSNGRKRPHDGQVNVPFAFMICRRAALLPLDLSLSRTMSTTILLPFYNEERDQKPEATDDHVYINTEYRRRLSLQLNPRQLSREAHPQT
jgi:hypothetical protein